MPLVPIIIPKVIQLSFIYILYSPYLKHFFCILAFAFTLYLYLLPNTEIRRTNPMATFRHNSVTPNITNQSLNTPIINAPATEDTHDGGGNAHFCPQCSHHLHPQKFLFLSLFFRLGGKALILVSIIRGKQYHIDGLFLGFTCAASFNPLISLDSSLYSHLSHWL